MKSKAKLSAVDDVKPIIYRETIDLLRDFLAQAERGEIIAVAIAGVQVNGSARTAASSVVNLSDLIGSIETIKVRIMSNVGRE